MDNSTIQAIVAAANVRVTWGLSLIAGSLVAVLSTSYVRPMYKWGKFIYLIFIPAWIYIVNSIRLGDSITRRGVAASVYPDRLIFIEAKMNDDFANQIDSFNIGLLFFVAWLACYLSWWCLSDFLIKKRE